VNPVIQALFALINFAAIAYLLKRFGGPLLVKRLQDHHAATIQSLDEAEKAEREANTALATCQADVAGLPQTLGAIQDQAIDLAKQGQARVQSATNADCERLQQQASQDIERERTLARQSIQSILVARSFEVARRQLVERMNGETQNRLVEQLIRNMEDGTCAITR
jgi:F0F1-type ATP synthase membrane subunit b/b'